jgi:hypothetical protein
MPLLERLDPAQDEADRLRTEARDQAAQLRLAGSSQAAAVVEQARENVEAVAAQAASATIAAARCERQAAEPDAAAEVTRRADERLPAYVDRVIAVARDLIAELSAPANEAVPR